MTEPRADRPYMMVVEGVAALRTEAVAIQEFTDRVNAKYETDYGTGFFDPALNGVYRMDASWGFGLTGDDLAGSPTRWIFDRA